MKSACYSACRYLILLIVVLPAFSYIHRSYAQFNGSFEIERHYLDMENFLDWKAYQPPLDWRYEWSMTDSGLLASIGSISMYEFYHLTEVRLSKAVGKYATFYYQQFEESFYSKEPIHQEAEFRLGTDFGFSIIGFPPYNKKYGHMGYAASYGYRFTENNARLSTTSQYAFFNEKNANNEKNKNDEKYIKTPDFNRLEAQFLWNDRLFFQADLKQVTKAEFYEELPEVTRTFQGNGGKISVDWNSPNGWLLGLTGFANEEYREQMPASSSDDLPDLEQALVLRWIDLYYKLLFEDSSFITLGGLWSEFSNQIDSSYTAHEYECVLATSQIYGFWQLARSDWFHWRFSLQAGQVDLDKDYEDIDKTIDDSNTEMKAGIGIILQEVENYRLFINTTWDLDIFTTRQWDGGNVQFQMVF